MSYSGAARRINLDNDLVIVAGGNESGKSSILKTLYYTLGATVYPFARRWERANVASLLKFTIDGVNFKAVRVASDVYVFNPDNTLRFHDWNKQKIAEEMNNLLGIPPLPVYAFLHRPRQRVGPTVELFAWTEWGKA